MKIAGQVSINDIPKVCPLLSRVVNSQYGENGTRVVEVAGVRFGGERPVVIGGPCAVESHEQTVGLAQAVKRAGDSPVDLFSLSRMLETAGSREQSVATCQRALSGGLPEEIEARALHQLALQYKRQHQHELAVATWLKLTRRASPLALEAFEELAIHYEHHQRNPKGAMEFTLAALERLREHPSLPSHIERFTHRLQRLQRKTTRLQSAIKLPIT